MNKRAMGILGAVLMAVPLPLQAVEGSERAIELDPFVVIGSADNLFFTPGSGYVVGGEEIRTQGYDSIDQLARRVPGVYYRTEDGYGLFPNISFRGVGSMRTTQLTVMEDGVLMAPAPYTAPAAYYTPTTGRMAGVEILKGSSQVRYGPSTTGGVLNYLSTPIPQAGEGRVRITAGENGELRFHGHYGETLSTEMGEIGILVEHYFRRTDGFKKVDSSPGHPGGDTGFRKNEPMLKVSWSPSRGPRQHLELKVGYTELVADETYLGLTTDDLRANPDRRYVSSRFDTIPTEQWRTFLRHAIELGEDTHLASTLYFNQFQRSWYKLQDVRRAGGQAVSLAEALAGAPFYRDGAAVPGTEGEPLAVLRGEAAGIWRVRDNNRSYQSQGIETTLRHTFTLGTTSHELEAGLRLHKDYEDRFQKQDDYQVDAQGDVVAVTTRPPGTQENRRGSAQALAFFLRDRIQFDQLVLTPGVRYERVRMTDTRRGLTAGSPEFNQVILERQGTIDVFAPGIGATWSFNDRWVAFAGVHRGFSLPGPGSVADPNSGIREETSIGYEAGLRYRDNSGLRAEAVLFWTDFHNLIVPDNIGGAGTGRTENAGDVRTRGIEIALTYDPGIRHQWGFRNPWSMALTGTDATLRSDANAGGTAGGAVESIFAGGRRGNRLPYIPRYQVSAGTGLEFSRLSVYLDAFYVPSTYASANNSDLEINPFGGPNQSPVPDARFGRNDAHFLLDLVFQFHLQEGLTLHCGAQNLLDRRYIASRLPHGPRPGQPRFLHAGLTWSF